MDKRIIEKIRKDFKPFYKKTLGILVYGSLASETNDNRSDIDICIVAPDYNPLRLYRETLLFNYDIRIFETMPLFLKMQVIENHKIIYSKDIYDLYEYFYRFRKIWKDQRYRQRLSKEELIDMFD